MKRWYTYKEGVYDLLTNNCQHFCVDILSIIDENQAQKIAKQMTVAAAKVLLPYQVSVQHYFYFNEIENAIRFLIEAMQQFCNDKKQRIQREQIISVIDEELDSKSDTGNAEDNNGNNNTDSKENDILKSKGVKQWDCNDVKTWLKQIKRDKYIPKLCDENEFTGEDLLQFKTVKHWREYLPKQSSSFRDGMYIRKNLEKYKIESDIIPE